jgi:hypothetical protein
VTISDFDPNNLGSYDEAPKLLHFQWNDKDSNVYRYVLVDVFKPNQIDHRTKVSKRQLAWEEQESTMNEDEVLQKYGVTPIY